MSKVVRDGRRLSEIVRGGQRLPKVVKDCPRWSEIDGGGQRLLKYVFKMFFGQLCIAFLGLADIELRLSRWSR